MRDRPSFTAAWVAACRTLGNKLPAAARLADDPYGASFAGPGAALFAEHLPRFASLPIWPFALYMQVRTRVIDDVLRAFVSAGGRQVLILGAGYDCRAARFAGELQGARVFEVDHPATQARKRTVLERAAAPSAPVTYLAWDFEARPMAELPQALAGVGHDPSETTLTVWEGVTMYLTEPAIDATVAAVAALSSPGSPLVMTYFERQRIERPSRARALVSRLVARAGEPFRFGWSPTALPEWAAGRGFDVEWDRDMVDLGRTLLPAAHARAIQEHASRVALLRRQAAHLASS